MAHQDLNMKPVFDLIIGDKTFSSWSMRAWLVAVQSNLPFKEINITLDMPKTREQILKYSPSGKVPALKQNKLSIWDSLAISEYIHELAPEAGLWPEEVGARALARSYAAEMHSGFSNIRNQLSMDLKIDTEARHLLPETLREIERILNMWREVLIVSEGPYLFGDFSIADAFFAPVVLRFRSYNVQIKDKMIQTYMDNIEGHHGVQFWIEEARKEKTARPVFSYSRN